MLDIKRAGVGDVMSTHYGIGSKHCAYQPALKSTLNAKKGMNDNVHKMQTEDVTASELLPAYCIGYSVSTPPHIAVDLLVVHRILRQYRI